MQAVFCDVLLVACLVEPPLVQVVACEVLMVAYSVERLPSSYEALPGP